MATHKARKLTDPRTAAAGRDRIQHEVGAAVRRTWKPMTAAGVMDCVYYCEKLNASHYQRVRRTFELFAIRTHRLTTRGGPDEWWWHYKHPFRATYWSL